MSLFWQNASYHSNFSEGFAKRHQLLLGEMQGKSQQMWRLEAWLSRATGSQSMWRTPLHQHSPAAHNLPKRRPGLGQTHSLPRKVIQPPGSVIHKEEETEPQCLFLCSNFWKPDHGAHYYLTLKPIESEEKEEKDRKNLGVFNRVRTKSRVGAQFLYNPCHVEPLLLADDCLGENVSIGQETAETAQSLRTRSVTPLLSMHRNRSHPTTCRFNYTVKLQDICIVSSHVCAQFYKSRKKCY